MSGLWRVLAYAMITLFLGVVLKELGFKGTRLVILLGTVSLLGAFVLYIGELFDMLPSLDDNGREYAVAMLKMVGVGYAFGICSDVCRELGENTLGNTVALLGRAEILLISLPFVKRIIERGIELI